jgi:biotin carboxyl carrier protein
MAPEREVNVTAADATDPRHGPREIARLADELLPVLIARLGASGLGEIEVRQDGWRLRLRRDTNGMSAPANDPAGHPSAARGARGQSAAHSQPSRRGSTAAHGESDTQSESTARRERGRVAITSPGVGYYQPRDGLAVGASVRAGDLLGHVEVLGVRHDVVVPENGILAVLSAQAGEAVEYGQPLARLEPEGRP